VRGGEGDVSSHDEPIRVSVQISESDDEPMVASTSGAVPPSLADLLTKVTEVQFRPDFTRFGISCLGEGMLLCMQRRVYDVADCNPGLSVLFNGAELNAKSFKDLACMYHHGPLPLVPLSTTGRW
jgi:hypothetical protein